MQQRLPSELIFEVLQSTSGQWQARGCNAPLQAEADDWSHLQMSLRQAIAAHYPADAMPEDRDIHFIHYPEASV